MSAPIWSVAELTELHRSFLEMRQRLSIEERRDLSFPLVLCRASTDRLRQACESACETPTCVTHWWDDIQDEAQLLLVEWLAADSLHYVALGIDEFGSWYWTLCCRACRRTADAFRDKASPTMAFVDPEQLTQCPAPSAVRGHRYDRLSRAIAQLPPGDQKEVILDWKAGLTADESADRRGISLRTVERLRHSGRDRLRELWDNDAIDDD